MALYFQQGHFFSCGDNSGGDARNDDDNDDGNDAAVGQLWHLLPPAPLRCRM